MSKTLIKETDTQYIYCIKGDEVDTVTEDLGEADSFKDSIKRDCNQEGIMKRLQEIQGYTTEEEECDSYEIVNKKKKKTVNTGCGCGCF